MWVGLLTDRITNKLEESNLINEHALNREPVPLKPLLEKRRIFLGQCNYKFKECKLLT